MLSNPWGKMVHDLVKAGDVYGAYSAKSGPIPHRSGIPLEMFDLLFTAGQYTLVSMVINSLGVQLDEGLPGWEI